jgi:hypothetical protein
MDEEQIVWEGTVDRGKWVAQVSRIPNSDFRGVLKIKDTDGVLKYQREVAVSSTPYVGPESKEVREWSKIILDWVDNKS